MTSDELSDRLLAFSVRVGKLVNALPATRLGRHIAGQLVRCGTAAAPNYEEACAAESKGDFVHKCRIYLKELRETRSWIRLIDRAELVSHKRLAELLDECKQLCNIIGKSVATASKK